MSVAAEKHVEEQVPFIGNLCDINRPTALSRKFCSLYTDEYADAMEVIEKSMDEAGAVHVMLEWLKVRSPKANYIANLPFRKK